MGQGPGTSTCVCGEREPLGAATWTAAAVLALGSCGAGAIISSGH